MQFNLKTTLNAYPKLTPSILSNYVTKTELEEKDYVDSTELATVINELDNKFLLAIKDFVKDVEVEGDNIVYGRVKGKWVPVFDIPQESKGIICWGMLNSKTLSAEQMMKLHRQNYLDGVNEYSVDDVPSENGYFWFASTLQIQSIMADSGLSYKQSVVEESQVSIDYLGEKLSFHCYRTQKLVALPGITYKFTVSV